MPRKEAAGFRVEWPKVSQQLDEQYLSHLSVIPPNTRHGPSWMFVKRFLGVPANDEVLLAMTSSSSDMQPLASCLQESELTDVFKEKRSTFQSRSSVQALTYIPPHHPVT